ncbi:MAG TPA: hypothetical protein VK892_11325 [Pyrinomonadaceae bacterium]|nr:hypothetical protein [Pyrinomonadaceae bacterium]
MIIDIVESIHGYPIRLTEERWYDHIVNNKPYMSGHLQDVLDAVYYPEFILLGNKGSKAALLNLGYKQWLHVFYIEYVNEDGNKDGFIITALIKANYDRKKIVWRRDS